MFQSRIWDRIPLYLAVAFALVALFIWPWWTVDDAFISYRYGKNLALFGELNWNPGSPPVEGYTGQFLPLMAGFLLWLGVEPVFPIKILSILFAAGTAWLLRRMLRENGASCRLANSIVLIFALQPTLYTHILGGLETIFFMFGVMACLAFLPQKNQGGSWPGWLSISLFFTGITRPEGLFLAGIVAVWMIWKIGRGEVPKSWGLWVGAALLLLLMIQLWRKAYYGYWTPNSWAAKSYSGSWINWESLKEELRFCFYFLGIPFLGLVSWAVSRAKETKIGFFRWEVGAVFSFGLFVLYLRTHLFMNYSYRFFLPVFPIALAMGALFWRKSKLSHSGIGVIVTVFALVFQGFLWVGVAQGELFFTRYYSRLMETEWMPIGKDLKNLISPTGSIICYMDAGAIPYYSGLKTWDFGKLNDPQLARNVVDNKDVIDYFFSKNADAVVFTSYQADTLDYLDESSLIQKDPRFSIEFPYGYLFSNDIGFPYFQFVFLKEPAHIWAHRQTSF